MLASSAVCPGISSTGNLVCYRLRTASVVDGEPDHYRRYSMTTSAVGIVMVLKCEEFTLSTVFHLCLLNSRSKKLLATPILYNYLSSCLNP